MCLADQNLLQHQVPWQSMRASGPQWECFLFFQKLSHAPRTQSVGNLQNCLHLQSMTLHCGHKLETGVRSWNSQFVPKGNKRLQSSFEAFPSYSLLEATFSCFLLYFHSYLCWWFVVNIPLPSFSFDKSSYYHFTKVHG